MKRIDVVTAILGQTSMLTAVVYGLVGLSGAYPAVAWKGIHRRAAVRA